MKGRKDGQKRVSKRMKNEQRKIAECAEQYYVICRF